MHLDVESVLGNLNRASQALSSGDSNTAIEEMILALEAVYSHHRQRDVAVVFRRKED